MALGLCIQFIDLSTSRNIEQTPTGVLPAANEEVGEGNNKDAVGVRI
jgi:hypothetical protein